MTLIRILCAAAFVAAAPVFAFADDITDAIEQARKAYQGGDLAGAKQNLDLASQLIGQKNAEGFAALLPAPLSGWKARSRANHRDRRQCVRRIDRDAKLSECERRQRRRHHNR